jgi:serralysin
MPIQSIQVNPSGNADIDGILWGVKWGATALTYGYPSSLQPYVGYTEIDGFASANTPGYSALVVRIIGLFDEVSGLSFSYQDDGGVANIRFAFATRVVYAPGNVTNVTTANGTVPDPAFFPDYSWGDTFFGTGLDPNNPPQIGTFEYAAWMEHEPGHALGLKHGHVTQEGHGVEFPALPTDHDSQEYSVMTYRRFVGQVADSNGALPGDVGSDYPSTLMQDDIAALQYLYGADYGTNNGNTTYTWSPTTGEMFINGVSQGVAFHNKLFLTIWDGGGTDTYDMSNYTTGVSIDLRPGNWSITSGSQLADLDFTDHPGVHMARGNIANAQVDPNFPTETASFIENAVGGAGNDVLIGNSINNVLTGNAGNDTMSGGDGNDTLFGGAGQDTINGQNGNDLIQGGFDVDVMDGGPGTDTVDYSYSSEKWVIDLASGVATPTSTGPETARNFENVIGSSADDTIRGTAGANVLNGGAGNDVLDGRGGADTLVGGTGNDTYFVDNAGDVVTENANEGTDTVHSFINYTLGTNLESLVLEGSALNGVGNAVNNTIIGDAADNFIDGRAGADSMQGGAGNDTYIVDNAGDVVIENVNQGTDTVRTSLNTYTLTANVENLTFTGAGAFSGTGNALGNAITGGASNDTLFGGGGKDVLDGGAGNDTLVSNDGGAGAFLHEANTLTGGVGNDTLIGDGSDTINGGAGTDTLQSENANPWNINLGTTSIETMLSGFGNDNVNGSTQTVGITVFASGGNDTVTGSNQNDFLWGGAGNDTLTGGAGNDLVFGDVGADSLSGGAGNDTLYGDSSDTHIDGGAGTDALYWAAGTNANINVGADAVEFVQTLGNNDTLDGSTATANLVLFVGAGNDTVTGGSGNDYLWGEAGNDILVGNGGNDTIVGGPGADRLTGGAGTDNLFGANGSNAGDGAADTFIFAAGWGTDYVYGFDDGVDKLDMTALHITFASLTITNPNGNADVDFGTNHIIVVGQAGHIGQADFAF